MKNLETYHLQITGPSGSGKTYFSERLHELGYPAFDADKFENLGITSMNRETLLSTTTKED